MNEGVVEKAYIVSGMPHILLGADQSESWKSLNESYKKIKKEIDESDADVILYFSTQWLSVLGYMFQADPNPEWLHVDNNWHTLGEMPYKFKVDVDFAQHYQAEVAKLGHNTRLVNYKGFPIDTGTIVAQKLLNPDNKIPASMVSCNMYSEKEENLKLGQAAAHALKAAGKKAIVVLVSNLSNRFYVKPISPNEDKISSLKDDEWNQKVLELFAAGELEDVSQCSREFAKQANADMGFRGLWWLNGLCGLTNDFKGEIYDYKPVWGAGAALVGLEPTRAIWPIPEEEFDVSEEGSQAEFAKELTKESEKVLEPELEAKPQNKKVNASKAPEPVGAYPHARIEGDFVFLSGVGPRRPNSKTIPGVELNEKGEITSYDVTIQTQSVIDNIKIILEESGTSLSKVVDIQVFLTNMKNDFKAFNAVYAKTFKDIEATRTTVEVGALPTPIAVEFKVVAKL